MTRRRYTFLTFIAHFVCGLLTGLLSGVLPFSSLLLFVFFLVYEWIEYNIRKDTIVRDIREYGIGLFLGVLVQAWYLFTFKNSLYHGFGF